SVILNLLPWQGQLIVPSATWLHRHPTWVQTALKALNSPLAGWVTTTFAAVKTLPLPTGTSAAIPSRVPIWPPFLAPPFAEPPLALALPDGWAAMPSPVEDGAAAGAWPASLASKGTAAVLHAVSTPAAPRTPAPSSTQRLVAH